MVVVGAMATIAILIAVSIAATGWIHRLQGGAGVERERAGESVKASPKFPRSMQPLLVEAMQPTLKDLITRPASWHDQPIDINWPPVRSERERGDRLLEQE